MVPLDIDEEIREVSLQKYKAQDEQLYCFFCIKIRVGIKFLLCVVILDFIMALVTMVLFFLAMIKTWFFVIWVLAYIGVSIFLFKAI